MPQLVFKTIHWASQAQVCQNQNWGAPGNFHGTLKTQYKWTTIKYPFTGVLSTTIMELRSNTFHQIQKNQADTQGENVVTTCQSLEASAQQALWLQFERLVQAKLPYYAHCKDKTNDYKYA